MKKALLAIVVVGLGLGGHFYFGGEPGGNEKSEDARSESPPAPTEEAPIASTPPGGLLRIEDPESPPELSRAGSKSATSPPPTDLSQIESTELHKTPEVRKAVEAAFEKSRESARALVVSLPPEGVFLVAYKRLGELEAGDPESAIALTDEIENDAALARFYEGLIEGVAAIDPDFAMELHAANREHFPETGTVSSIVLAATRAGNPKLALWSIRKKLDPSEHDEYYAKVYGTWAAMDPEAAIADISRRGQSSARGAGAGAIFRQWARMDRTAVETWLANHPDAGGFLVWQAKKALNQQPAQLKENAIEMPVFRSTENR